MLPGRGGMTAVSLLGVSPISEKELPCSIWGSPGSRVLSGIKEH